MYAIREIADINNNFIKIRLPDDFPSKQAEIIILPMNITQKKNKNNKHALPDLISIDINNYASQIILEDRR